VVDNPRRWVAVGLAALAVGGLSCLEQPAVAPHGTHAEMAIRATVHGLGGGSGADPSVRIHVYYQRTTGGVAAAISLPSAPGSVPIASGTSTVQPVLVDLAPCLADPQRVPAGVPGCQITLSLVLVLAGNVVADSESSSTSGPVLPGAVTKVPPITLTAPAFVTINPRGIKLNIQAPAVTVAAIVSDDSGRVLPGHPVLWTSSAPNVASVTSVGPDTALVTGIAVGNTFIKASTGGIADSISVFAFSAPVAIIGLSSAAVTDTFSLGSGIDPPAITIAVSDSGTLPLTGLALDTVVYNPVALNGYGAPVSWLQTSLSDTLAPTTVTLQAVPAQIGGPTTTGTYTATFHVTSPAAVNSPRKIVHTMVVIP